MKLKYQTTIIDLLDEKNNSYRVIFSGEHGQAAIYVWGDYKVTYNFPFGHISKTKAIKLVKDYLKQNPQ